MLRVVHRAIGRTAAAAVSVGRRERACLHTGGLATGFVNTPTPVNEPVLSYGKGSAERTLLQTQIKQLRSHSVEVPLLIGGKEIRTGDTAQMIVPHEHRHVLGTYHRASERNVLDAIAAAAKAKRDWAALDFESRASVFLRAAELLKGPYRQLLNAATVLGQSKNFFQAEIDSACELIDFLRFNVYYARKLMEDQPQSSPGVWNRMQLRPLEGFVYAATPFNFTAIAGNLTTAPALMGNTVVWKPSDSAVYSGYFIMKLLQEAGLPDGVINFVPGDPAMVTRVVLSDPDLAGIHYTGSTPVLRSLFAQVGAQMDRYRSFPRIVGESGGKDFVVAHPSADVPALCTALLRGAFEYAGQKCSAASRAYIPSNLWPQLSKLMESQYNDLVVGNPELPETFVNAVINRAAYHRLSGAIAEVDNTDSARILLGGGCDDTVGYFIHPTVVQVTDPRHKLMRTELFGPVLSVYVYDERDWTETLRLVSGTSDYALTGSVFARDRYAIAEAMRELEHAAGNFYINDKPTGAVVGQQPFGGARLSGTNDKAGSALNLLRWTSPRAIKETFVPPTQPLYPYMRE